MKKGKIVTIAMTMGLLYSATALGGRVFAAEHQNSTPKISQIDKISHQISKDKKAKSSIEAEIPAPVVNEPVTTDDTAITGIGSEANHVIVVTDSDGKYLGSGLVNADKTFSVTIPKQAAYTILHIIESDGVDTSPITEVTVHDNQIGNAITLLDDYSLSSNDGFVHGSYVGSDVALIRAVVDGVKGDVVGIYPGNGQLRCYIGGRVSSVDQDVEIQILDINSNVLDSKKVNIVP